MFTIYKHKMIAVLLIFLAIIIALCYFFHCNLCALNNLPKINDDERVISKNNESEIESQYLNGGIITKIETAVAQITGFGDLQVDNQLTEADKEITFVKQENNILPVNNSPRNSSIDLVGVGDNTEVESAQL